MKNYLTIVLALSSICMLTSCNGQNVVISNETTKSEAVISEKALIEDINDEVRSFEVKNAIVKITGYYSEPKSLHNDDALILESKNCGEYVEVVIDGEICEFEHLSLIWDSEKNILVKDKRLHYFDKLNNKVVLIKTYMPEGIPSEMIRWKSSSGKVYEFIIRENGVGEEGNKYYFKLE